jgi:hypothetical protein
LSGYAGVDQDGFGSPAQQICLTGPVVQHHSQVGAQLDHLQCDYLVSL